MAADSYMEFLDSNLINTTTQFDISNNDSLAENLLNPDRNIQFYTDGLNDDLTSCSISIDFSSTITVDRIALLDHNWKKFNIYYNGVTANTFAIANGPTTTSQYISNSETSQYLRVTPVANVTRITFDVYSTQVSNSEKAVGYIIASEQSLVFTRQPAAGSYSPKVDPEQVEHKMSDGGTRLHTVQKKYSADIKMKYISRTFRDQLKTVYDTQAPFIFCPFGTATSWDGVIFEAVWPGNFDFYKFSDDAVASGFSGSISLRETSF